MNITHIQDFDLSLATYFAAYENALVLDIRTQEEYCQNHICHSVLIPTPLPPLTDIQKTRLRSELFQIIKTIDPSIKANRPIVVYCKKGIRADIAKQILKEQGFTKVMSLGGVDTVPLKDLISGILHNNQFKVCYCEIKCK